MMFIKLTNATKDFEDKILLLNTRYIVSVFGSLDTDKNPITVVYGALQTSWNVKESVEKVLEMIGNEK